MDVSRFCAAQDIYIASCSVFLNGNARGDEKIYLSLSKNICMCRMLKKRVPELVVEEINFIKW